MKFCFYYKWPFVLLPLTLALSIWLLWYLGPKSTFFPIGNTDLIILFVLIGLGVLVLVASSLRSVKKWLENSPALLFWALMLLTFIYPIVCSMNMLLDFGPPQKIIVVINDKYTTDGRGRSDWLVIGNPEIGDRRWGVWEALYNTVQVGDKIAVPVHSGAFGIPWFDGANDGSVAVSPF